MSRLAELRRRKAASDSARLRYAALVHQLDPAPHRPSSPAPRNRSAGGLTPAPGGSWRPAETKPAAPRPRPRWLVWRRPSRRTRRAAGRSPTFSGLYRRHRAERPTCPGALSIPAFTDDAERSGIAFIFDNGRSELRQLPETMSGGVALLDFDGDGWLDIYAVQGGPFPPRDHPPFGDRLFRNRGDGRFEDVTSASGLAALPGGYGHGVAVGDYDNDGRPDLFVTRWRSYALYHNIGHGRFEDVTATCRARRRP